MVNTPLSTVFGYISGGAGFQPSTVLLRLGLLVSQDVDLDGSVSAKPFIDNMIHVISEWGTEDEEIASWHRGVVWFCVGFLEETKGRILVVGKDCD